MPNADKVKYIFDGMNKRKIINDPVYGFTTIPDDLIYDIIQHPYFQRLRRIRQLGLTDYVYPGASHTRFQHALGALHLMTEAIDVLRTKGITITDREAQGAQIAILLHDIGHSPYSHALEKKLIPWSHEKISLGFMQILDEEFYGALREAIKIFSYKHPKKFLSQLVSGQLDVDRMDYLNRDSFFTGVSEGVIGYERIIKMLNVFDNQLVVEEKGIYSVEKFLHSRRIMYWQVYLHKTVLAAEKMLINWLDLLIKSKGWEQFFPSLGALKAVNLNKTYLKIMLAKFSNIDDSDVTFALKSSLNAQDPNIIALAEGLLYRKLWKCQLSNKPFATAYVKSIEKASNYPELLFKGVESNAGYTVKLNEIMILKKERKVVPLSKTSEFQFNSKVDSKFFLIYK